MTDSKLVVFVLGALFAYFVLPRVIGLASQAMGQGE